MGNEQDEIDVAYTPDNDIKVNVFDLATMIYLIQHHVSMKQIMLTNFEEEKLDRLTTQVNEFMRQRLLELI